MVHILQVGSKKPALHAVSRKILTLRIHNQIHLEPEWIPRELNERADYLSRIIDLDDWCLNPIIFNRVDNVWAPHTIDRFADFYNKQTPRFNSRCWNPSTEAVDAFTVVAANSIRWWSFPARGGCEFDMLVVASSLWWL